MTTDTGRRSVGSKEVKWKDANGSHFEFAGPRERDVVQELVEETPAGKKKIRVRRGAK